MRLFFCEQVTLAWSKLQQRACKRKYTSNIVVQQYFREETYKSFEHVVDSGLKSWESPWLKIPIQTLKQKGEEDSVWQAHYFWSIGFCMGRFVILGPESLKDVYVGAWGLGIWEKLSRQVEMWGFEPFWTSCFNYWFLGWWFIGHIWR